MIEPSDRIILRRAGSLRLLSLHEVSRAADMAALRDCLLESDGFLLNRLFADLRLARTIRVPGDLSSLFGGEVKLAWPEARSRMSQVSAASDSASARGTFSGVMSAMNLISFPSFILVGR